MEHDCKFRDVVGLMQQDIKDIKKDVRSLLKFKYQIMSGAAIIGTILAFVINKILK